MVKNDYLIYLTMLILLYAQYRENSDVIVAVVRNDFQN